MRQGWSEEDLDDLLRSRPDIINLSETKENLTSGNKNKEVANIPASSSNLPLTPTKNKEGELFYRFAKLRAQEKEDIVQARVFRWTRQNVAEYPRLKSVISYPSGGYRPDKTAKTMKITGQAKGFPDIFSVEAEAGYAGLAIEMKRKYTQPRDEQVDWLNYLTQLNWFCCICWHQLTAIQVLSWYFGINQQMKLL